ncbi:Syn-copalyl diphosphate synthase [Platanthera guangdongensis]|uniref:Syn-copalyl diphosphate synthase n=1 Tax=Platanthera guangdongensis TaxID=2320717 RepID=A0ABR2LWH1_9ASPA
MLAEAVIAAYHRSTTSKVKLSFTEDFSINRQNLWSELNQRGEEQVGCILGLLGFLTTTPDIYGSLQRAGNMIPKCSDRDIDLEMQELVKCVIEQRQSPNGLNRETKQTFMAVVRSFYYMAWCPSTTLNNHISKAEEDGKGKESWSDHTTVVEYLERGTAGCRGFEDVVGVATGLVEGVGGGGEASRGWKIYL